MAPSIDFVIPFWGDDHYRVESFKYLNRYLGEHFSGLESPAMCYTLALTDPQSRSASRNRLANKGTGEIIVFIDADSIPAPNALMDSISHVITTKSWIFPFNTYYNLTQAGSEDFKTNPPWKSWRPEDGYEYEYVFPGPDPIDRPPAVGGSLVIHRKAWEETPGYDERFQGWGGEDRAFVMMLETLIGDGDRYPAPIYHLWHPAPESDRFDHANWDYNRQLLARYQDAHRYPQRMRGLVKTE